MVSLSFAGVVMTGTLPAGMTNGEPYRGSTTTLYTELPRRRRVDVIAAFQQQFLSLLKTQESETSHRLTQCNSHKVLQTERLMPQSNYRKARRLTIWLS